MEKINEICECICIGLILTCLVSIATSLRTISENTTPSSACEVVLE